MKRVTGKQTPYVHRGNKRRRNKRLHGPISLPHFRNKIIPRCQFPRHHIKGKTMASPFPRSTLLSGSCLYTNIARHLAPMHPFQYLCPSTARSIFDPVWSDFVPRKLYRVSSVGQEKKKKFNGSGCSVKTYFHCNSGSKAGMALANVTVCEEDKSLVFSEQMGLVKSEETLRSDAASTRPENSASSRNAQYN